MAMPSKMGVVLSTRDCFRLESKQHRLSSYMPQQWNVKRRHMLRWIRQKQQSMEERAPAILGAQAKIRNPTAHVQ